MLLSSSPIFFFFTHAYVGGKGLNTLGEMLSVKILKL